MYLSYTEYQDYGGTLDETTYNAYEFEAEAIINYYTFDRLKQDSEVNESVKRLVYTLVDIAERKAAALALGMSSSSETSASSQVYITKQSNDGVATSYNGMSASNLFNICKSETKNAVIRYLSNVVNEAGRKVLFRGLYPGE